MGYKPPVAMVPSVVVVLLVVLLAVVVGCCCCTLACAGAAAVVVGLVACCSGRTCGKTIVDHFTTLIDSWLKNKAIDGRGGIIFEIS